MRIGAAPFQGGFVRRTLALCLVGAAPGGFTSSAWACDGAQSGLPALSVAQAGQAVSCLINRRRGRHGLGGLKGSSVLGRAAAEHSQAMTADHFFAHDGVDGTPETRAQGFGYLNGARVWGIGEDLEWASGGLASPLAIVEGWMHSPEHRRVILTAHFRQLGVGVVQGSPLGADPANSMTYTALFGYRRSRQARRAAAQE
jgi:uncharacterized protein YkwD